MNVSLREYGESLFAPGFVQDVRDRLDRIERAGCPCDESVHLNALHDLAHDDVPVLLRAIEVLTIENGRLKAAHWAAANNA